MLDLKKLLTKMLSGMATPVSFTPQLYDVNTFVRNLNANSGKAYKLGGICIGWIFAGNVDMSGVSAMIQLRGFPCKRVLHAQMYIQNAQALGGTLTTQISGYDGTWYPRPNIKSSDITNSSSAGILSVFFVGTDYLI